ncbi:MAG: DUF2147 domain-containing protein [Pseudomonadota bacterium]|nr:DUF2147 domain-containing protein [Pseudomonadota bacterium]
MSRAFIIAAALVGLAFAGAADARSPIEGRWAKGKLQIDIKPCGQTLCGTVVKASPKQQARAERGSGTELIGATLIKDIRPAGPRNYRARVFVPDRNMNATGKIQQVAPDQLKVSGCVLAIICKSANWKRVD